MYAYVAFTVAMLASATAFAAPQHAAEPATPALRSSKTLMQMAQNCGWFAILGCFPSRGVAESWNDRIEGGYVINTSSAAYPNFRPGSYCVVNGPTSRGRAQSVAAGWRRWIPDAYAKNSC
jgi:hypothetical protein